MIESHLLDALEYARAGISVFPCKPHGKEPMTEVETLEFPEAVMKRLIAIRGRAAQRCGPRQKFRAQAGVDLGRSEGFRDGIVHSDK